MHVRWVHDRLDHGMPHASCPACCWQVSNGLRDLSGNVMAWKPFPLLPINCHAALGGNASHCMTALGPRLSMFGVESLQGATPDRRVSICHPRRERLPSSNIAPIPNRASTLTGLGLPGCPLKRGFRGEQRQSTLFPFPALRQVWYLVMPGHHDR